MGLRGSPLVVNHGTHLWHRVLQRLIPVLLDPMPSGFCINKPQLQSFKGILQRVSLAALWQQDKLSQRSRARQDEMTMCRHRRELQLFKGLRCFLLFHFLMPHTFSTPLQPSGGEHEYIYTTLKKMILPPF